ncbi:hypothetical protein VDG1235_704 [Verrucomicrobiia bacterium DG1235]|nr:hypothetical protein VDG1235_704 [Verrucomicrobiae bacterium DG1235]
MAYINQIKTSSNNMFCICKIKEFELRSIKSSYLKRKNSFSY